MNYLNNCLFILFLSASICACSVSKEARSMKKAIDGDWVLQTISTEGITGITKTTVFNEADFSCFIGSKWNFINNNSMGSYQLADKSSGCVPVNRLIRWTIFEPEGMDKSFQFKRLDDKKKPMDNGDGYRLKVVELYKDRMKLRSEIVVSGNTGAVIYNFIKK